MYIYIYIGSYYFKTINTPWSQISSPLLIFFRKMFYLLLLLGPPVYLFFIFFLKEKKSRKTRLKSLNEVCGHPPLITSIV